MRDLVGFVDVQILLRGRRRDEVCILVGHAEWNIKLDERTLELARVLRASRDHTDSERATRVATGDEGIREEDMSKLRIIQTVKELVMREQLRAIQLGEPRGLGPRRVP